MRLPSGRFLSLLLIAALIVAFLVLVQLNGWHAHLKNWLNLLVRWTHVVIGIAWIGTSFYFIFLENSLNRKKDLRPELAGNLWAVHGGGFYYVEKYKIAPAQLPEKLHWFKWEAYLTWISGIVLLAVVYYADAGLVMVDESVRRLSPLQAVLVGIASLGLGWLAYDRLCRTPLVERRGLFALTGFLLTAGLAFGLSQLLSGRAAFMHVGAMLGTLMAGNVFFVIIPSQRALVRAAQRGEPPDPRQGRHAGLRSLHNNYMTLPVVFVMISSHFPMTYGHTANWALLAGLFVASVAVRHVLNQHERGRDAAYLLPLATLVVLALAYVTAPPPAATAAGPPVAFRAVETVIAQRCRSCHAAEPSDAIFTSAPKGIRFDTPEQIRALAESIRTVAVDTDYMPLGNRTGMVPEERELLRRWIAQGASLD